MKQLRRRVENKEVLKDQYVEPCRYGAKGFSYLTLEKRKKLQKMLEDGKPQKEIATKLNMSRSTIYYEKMRMGSLDIPYDAYFANQHAHDSGRVDVKKRTPIPRSYHQHISKMYRLLCPALERSCDKQLTETIKHCIILLEKMGANPEKMKRPVTGTDIERIIALHKEGRNISEIERLTNRSRSTVHGVIKRHEKNKQQPVEEIIYEYLRKKWINE